MKAEFIPDPCAPEPYKTLHELSWNNIVLWRPTDTIMVVGSEFFPSDPSHAKHFRVGLQINGEAACGIEFGVN